MEVQQRKGVERKKMKEEKRGREGRMEKDEV